MPKNNIKKKKHVKVLTQKISKVLKTPHTKPISEYKNFHKSKEIIRKKNYESKYEHKEHAAVLSMCYIRTLRRKNTYKYSQKN